MNLDNPSYDLSDDLSKVISGLIKYFDYLQPNISKIPEADSRVLYQMIFLLIFSELQKFKEMIINHTESRKREFLTKIFDRDKLFVLHSRFPCCEEAHEGLSYCPIFLKEFINLLYKFLSSHRDFFGNKYNLTIFKFDDFIELLKVLLDNDKLESFLEGIIRREELDGNGIKILQGIITEMFRHLIRVIDVNNITYFDRAFGDLFSNSLTRFSNLATVHLLNKYSIS